MTSKTSTIAKMSKPLIFPPRREKDPSRAVIGRDHDPTGSAAALHVCVHAILHKTGREETVRIMYLRTSGESAKARRLRASLGTSPLFKRPVEGGEQVWG